MIKKYFTFIFIFLILSLPAHSVIFDMKKTQFGSYLRSSYWNWANKTPFSQSSSSAGTSVTWNDEFSNLMSYEFGFLYNTASFTWRFGLEFIQPAALAGVKGRDATTQALYYTLDSSLVAYIPKVGIELNLKTWQESRLWMFYEYGAATLTVQNTYTMTAAGTAANGGTTSFREEVSSYQSMAAAALGFETLVNDNTTICIETGYRFLKFSDINHSTAVTNFQGAKAVGAKATQIDGSKREIAMSTPYVGVNLRIWIY